MLGKVKKPSLKRRPDSGTPIKTKKLKPSIGEFKGTKDIVDLTEVKIKPKKHSVESKPALNVKSKPTHAKFTKSKKPLNNQKFSKGSAPASPGKKPNWVEIKQEKKQQKVARKEKKHGLEVYELSMKAKALWEKLRSKATSDGQKTELCEELFKLVKNDVGMLIHSHDLARVIQSLMKHGTADMHTHIADKLSQCFVKASTSKYGKFCVKAALKKCSQSSRGALVQCSLGSVVKLFCHKFGTSIIEDIYSVWANSSTRRAMRLEFYGELGRLLTIPTMRKHLLDDLPEDLKPAILAAAKLNISRVLDKKHLFKSTLLHAVLLDFLRVCDEHDREEILEATHTEIESLLTTSEGQRVAIMILWHGTNKMKKVAVKSVKGKVKQFAETEFGHSFIMAMFDTVDDTVLLNKVIVPELLADIDALLTNEYGRRVVLYLVAHRDPAYFHPLQLELLKQGDSVRNSKKDDKVRVKEVLAVISESVLKKVSSDASVWCKDSSTAMVMLAVFKSAQGGDVLDSAYKALVDYVLDPESTIELTEENPSRIHVIESCGVHMALKKLMIHEKGKASAKENTFAKCFVENLTDESLALLLQYNRGAFTLVFVMENGDKSTVKKLKLKLSNVLEDSSNKRDSSGLKILRKKLEDKIK